MSTAAVTGAAALSDLSTAVSTFLATDAQSATLDQQLITALQTEVALLNSEKASEADPVKIESIVSQLAQANAARVTANAAVQSALDSVATPVTPVAPAPTTLSLSADSTGLVFSGSVVGTSTPTGTVTLSDSTGLVSGTGTLDSTGAFAITLPAAPAAGTYSVIASYGGDAANAASTGSTSVVYATADAPPADGGDTPGGSTL